MTNHDRRVRIELLAIFGLAMVAAGCGASDGAQTDETGETSTDGETSDASQDPPAVPTTFDIDFAQVKQFEFGWESVMDAQYYQLLESVDGQAPFEQVGDDVVGLATSLTVPLYARHDASYILRACNEFGCTDSERLDVTGSLADAVGYFKASNPDEVDYFGTSVALSGDGSTLAVGATRDAGTGTVHVYERDELGAWTQQAYIVASNVEEGDYFGTSVALSDDGHTLIISAAYSADEAGAVYVYERGELGVWTQQAYIEASNPDAGDYFGYHLALSADGRTLAVGAPWEASNAIGIDGDQSDDSTYAAGAVYMFARDETNVWTQRAYIKASNSDASDQFGLRLALSGDGHTLAVGALGEASQAIGIDGDQIDNSAEYAGAVYVYERDGLTYWKQQAYIKASNTDAFDKFGDDVALSADGRTLAVGAGSERSAAIGIDGDQADNSTFAVGAVYVYERDGLGIWTQQVYIKASNPDESDFFGESVELSGDGRTLVVGSKYEESSAVGIEGDQADNSANVAGAVYVYEQLDVWTQRAYVKASNAGQDDYFGTSVALSRDGRTLAVGAHGEASHASGIGGDQTDDSAVDAGAVYLY